MKTLHSKASRLPPLLGQIGWVVLRPFPRQVYDNGTQKDKLDCVHQYTTHAANTFHPKNILLPSTFSMSRQSADSLVQTRSISPCGSTRDVDEWKSKPTEIRTSNPDFCSEYWMNSKSECAWTWMDQCTYTMRSFEWWWRISEPVQVLYISASP